MTLKHSPTGPIPETTARVVQTAFPKGIVYMTMRDELGTFFEMNSWAMFSPDS